MSQPHKILPTKTKQYNEMRSTLEGYERRELTNKERVAQLEAALTCAREALEFYKDGASANADVFGQVYEGRIIDDKPLGTKAIACLATLGELLEGK